MKTIINNGHKIEVKSFGTEKIVYDGEIVSKRISMFGATHVFAVKEDNNDVQYEVEIGTRWHLLGFHCTVRCNGKIIFTDK